MQQPHHPAGPRTSVRTFTWAWCPLRVGVIALVSLSATVSRGQTPEPSTPASATPGLPTRSIDKVVITGSRFREQAGKASLSGDELSRIPGTGGDPMRAIQSLPGVASVDDASSDPAVRGSRPGDNAYYADFLPVGYLFHVGGLASVFNPALISRFTMASAAWSPEYGDVVGAVFDVNLRNPRTDRLGGQLDFSLLGANALIEGPLSSDLSFFLAGRRSWFDLVSKTGEDAEEGLTFTVPVYTDSQGRLLWNLNDRHRLRADFSTATDRIDFTVKAGGKAATRDPILAGTSSDRQAFASAAVVLESELSEQIGNRLALGQMNERRQFRLGGAGTVNLRFDTTYLRQQMVHRGFIGHEITVGASLQSRQVEAALDFNFPRCTEFDPNCDISTAPRLTTTQRARQNSADIYLSDRWTIAPQWTLVPGLRVNRQAAQQSTLVEPRFAVEFSPDKDTVLSAGLGRHSQPPAGEESLAVIGNPRLAPIRSTHAVIGATRQLRGGWSAKAEVYTKTFSGYAVADPALNYRNGASGSAAGLELLVKKDPAGGRWSGFASVSLSRAERQVDGTGLTFPFDYDQPVIVNLVGAYRHSDRWTWGARWSYRSGSPFTPVVGTGLFPDGRVRPVFGSVNSQRVPAYHRLDLRADYKRTDRLTAYFELINAYNRRNVSGYSYSPDYQTRDEILQLSILPSVGVTYSF
jgi:hypothetical protein